MPKLYLYRNLQARPPRAGSNLAFVDHRAVATPITWQLASARRGQVERGFHTLDNPEPVHIDVVCQAAGLVTSGYSFGYVAHWSAGDTKAIHQTAERVVTCARGILESAGLLATGDVAAAAA